MLLCLSSIGCSGAAARSSSVAGARSSVRSSGAAHAQAVPALRAVRVASVAAGTYGPYVGSGPSDTLLLWGEARSGERAFYSLSLAENLVPRGAPRRVAKAPAELGLLAVKATGRGLATKDGKAAAYVVVSANPEASGAQEIGRAHV